MSKASDIQRTLWGEPNILGSGPGNGEPDPSLTMCMGSLIMWDTMWKWTRVCHSSILLWKIGTLCEQAFLIRFGCLCGWRKSSPWQKNCINKFVYMRVRSKKKQTGYSLIRNFSIPNYHLPHLFPLGDCRHFPSQRINVWWSKVSI